MFKYTIFTVLAVVAVLNQPIFANDVEDLLKKLEAAVDEALVKANNTLEEAKADVNAAAKTIEDTAQSGMQGAEDEFQAELDALKEKAANAGVNITDCLGADETALVTLPTTGTNTMVDCVGGEINNAFKYAQDALAKVQTAVNDLENIKQEIKDCGHGLSSVKCLAKLALKIEEDITKLPTTIEADAAAAALCITQLKSEVEACANKALDKVESDGKALIEKIGLCVAGKIIS